MRVEVQNSESLPTLRHGTWHLWGLCAPGDDANVNIVGPQHLLESMHTVIVPSYWGVPRQQRLALALLEAELNPYILPLVDAVLELNPATVSHSILVEVEENRVCVTRISSGPDGETASRMTHLVGANDSAALVETVIALAFQLTVYPEEPLGMPDDVEVSGGRGMTEYPPRWQEDIEFVVAEVPPGMAEPRRALLAERLRDRGFLVFDCPANRLADPPELSLLGAVHSPHSVAHSGAEKKLDEVDELITAEAEKTTSNAGTKLTARSNLVPAVVIATLMLLVVIISLIVWRVGDGDSGNSRDKTGRGDAAMVPRPAQPPQSSQPPDLAPPQSETARPDATSPAAPGAINEVTLTNAGVTASFPAGWQLDPTSPLDRMTAVDGDNMRVLALAYPLTTVATLDHIVAGLSSDAAADDTKSTPERRQVMGIDVVVVVERLPSGNSVVLWHHKIVDGTQISVGCQFRGTQIPTERPVCDQVVQSARPEA